MSDIPTIHSGVIPGHPKKFTYKQLDHWLHLRGWTLFSYQAHLFGGTPTERNKIALLALSLDAVKPHVHKTKLGLALYTYTTLHHESYDSIFAEKIHKRFPHWFINSANVNKAALLALPCGASRPSSKTKLGRMLCSYTYTSSNCYDPLFKTKIHKRFPHWFVKTADVNKTTLLTLPRTARRPPSTTKLGSALGTYIYATKPTYDLVFAKKIRKRFPHWFINSADVNKAALLTLTLGAPRPSRNTKLGGVLREYINSSADSYDPIFKAKIRKRFPHWFRK